MRNYIKILYNSRINLNNVKIIQKNLKFINKKWYSMMYAYKDLQFILNIVKNTQIH